MTIPFGAYIPSPTSQVKFGIHVALGKSIKTDPSLDETLIKTLEIDAADITEKTEGPNGKGGVFLVKFDKPLIDTVKNIAYSYGLLYISTKLGDALGLNRQFVWKKGLANSAENLLNKEDEILDFALKMEKYFDKHVPSSRQ